LGGIATPTGILHRPAGRPAARQRVTRQRDPRRSVRRQHRHRQRGKRVLRQPVHELESALQPSRSPDGRQHVHQRALFVN